MLLIGLGEGRAPMADRHSNFFPATAVHFAPCWPRRMLPTLCFGARVITESQVRGHQVSTMKYRHLARDQRAGRCIRTTEERSPRNADWSFQRRSSYLSCRYGLAWQQAKRLVRSLRKEAWRRGVGRPWVYTPLASAEGGERYQVRKADNLGLPQAEEGKRLSNCSSQGRGHLPGGGQRVHPEREGRRAWGTTTDNVGQPEDASVRFKKVQKI